MHNLQPQPQRTQLMSLLNAAAHEVEDYLEQGWKISHQQYVPLRPQADADQHIVWCVTLRRECQTDTPPRNLMDAALFQVPTVPQARPSNTPPSPFATTPRSPFSRNRQPDKNLTLAQSIKLVGRADRGAVHRGISIARDLINEERWDGEGEIWFTDVYDLHLDLDRGDLRLTDLTLKRNEYDELHVVTAVPRQRAIIPYQPPIVSAAPRPQEAKTA